MFLSSLGTWFLSVQLSDLLWPLFLLAGAEHVRIAPVIPLAGSALALWLFLPWAWWADRSTRRS